MNSKLNKNKEYYLDGRTSTAKKGRKNRHNQTKTPISNSVSYNHHKYEEKEGTFQSTVSKTKPVSGRQMKMMMRCLQGYCSFEDGSCEELAKRYRLTSRMFDYLQNSFKLISSEREVQRNRVLLEQETVQASIRCETCEELGGSCNSYQREVMRKEIGRDNQRLEGELMGHFERKEEILNILESKEETQNDEEELEKLREIECLQREILQELELGNR